MTAKRPSTRETIRPPNPATSPKVLLPKQTPTRPSRTQSKRRSGTCITTTTTKTTKTTQLTIKIRMHYWHTAPPAGRAMTNPVRMTFCCSGVLCRRNNGPTLQIIRDLIGGGVDERVEAAVRVPVRIEISSSSSSKTEIRIRLYKNGRGRNFREKEGRNK